MKLCQNPWYHPLFMVHVLSFLVAMLWPYPGTMASCRHLPRSKAESGKALRDLLHHGHRHRGPRSQGRCQWDEFRQNGCIAMMQLGNEVQKHGDTWDAVQRGEGRQTSHTIWYAFHICIGYDTGKSLSLSITVGELLWYAMTWPDNSWYRGKAMETYCIVALGSSCWEKRSVFQDAPGTDCCGSPLRAVKLWGSHILTAVRKIHPDRSSLETISHIMISDVELPSRATNYGIQYFIPSQFDPWLIWFSWGDPWQGGRSAACQPATESIATVTGHGKEQSSTDSETYGKARRLHGHA